MVVVESLSMFSNARRRSWDLNVVSFLGIRPHLGGDGRPLLVVAGVGAPCHQQAFLGCGRLVCGRLGVCRS